MPRSTSPCLRFLAAARRTVSVLATLGTGLLALAVVASPSHGQLGPTGTQFWNQGSPGVGATLQAGAETGRALAIGDFNCDFIDDLAIGMPGDEVGGESEAGRVLVLYGSEGGPGTDERDLLSQDTPGVQDATEAQDRFGESLAAGHFDGDTCDDLAIGAPGESFGDPEIVEAGAVHVLYGSVLGLTVAGNDLFTQATAGMPGTAQAGDRFGSVLSTAHLSGDFPDELVIGVPDEDLEGDTPVTDAGAVHILLGGPDGLSAAESLLFVSGSGAINWVPGDFDRFGSSFAGFLIGDPAANHLAIGAPGRDVVGQNAAGAVVILFDPTSVSPTVAFLAQGGLIPGNPEAFDHCGAALAAGDFDGDGQDELVIGIPDEDNEAELAEAAGAVIVYDPFFGDAQVWVQGDLAPESSEPFDRFGESLATGDWNGDGRDDLAIGVPGETLGGLADAGVVHALLGGASGLTTTGRQLWLQTIDPSEAGDEFGATLAAGRLSGHTGHDLAIGVPGEDLGAAGETGGVNVLFSIALFVDGFENSLWPWSNF